MNRKYFISSIIPLGATLSAIAGQKNIEEPDAPLKTPPYLKKGDVIGITCPAGYITLEEIQPAINKIKDWGSNFEKSFSVGKMARCIFSA